METVDVTTTIVPVTRHEWAIFGLRKTTTVNGMRFDFGPNKSGAGSGTSIVMTAEINDRDVFLFFSSLAKPVPASRGDTSKELSGDRVNR